MRADDHGAAGAPIASEDRGPGIGVSGEPQSPFLPEPAYAAETDEGVAFPAEAQGDSAAPDTPFLTEYSLSGAETELYETELHREIMAEIQDDEFDEAIVDLTNELAGIAQQHFVGESTFDPIQAQRFLESYVAPLEEEIEGLIDSLLRESAPIDGENLREGQLDAFLEEFQYRSSLASPELEDFFGKVFKKIKKVAKKAVKTAKRAGKFLKKLSPIHMVLSRLQKMVKPLLKRVLRFALNKIPARYRPLAKKLARRFVKESAETTFDAQVVDEFVMLEDAPERSDALAADPEAAAVSPSLLGSEFDALIAGFILEGEGFDHDPAAVQYLDGELGEGGDVDSLVRARERFIEGIASLEDGGDPEPHVEQFVVAVLAGLKLGIRIIGRKRVVRYLSKLVARLIRRYVGKSASRPLARVLVDAGLRLVRLESPEDAAAASAGVLAATVEEAVERFASNTPDQALEDDALLEAFAQEAVEDAAASNFPPSVLRPDLRGHGESKGAWAFCPEGAGAKRYKKFTREFKVTLTPEAAQRIRTFGGLTLHNELRDRLGIPIDRRPAEATLHLFEAVRGTRLSEVARLETGVPGLGSGSRRTWTQFHPLTPEAAALLIPRDVGLAREVDPRFLADRNHIGVGQRFYFLEVPGARPIEAPAGEAVDSEARGTVARATGTRVLLDFRSKRVVVDQFLSEADANRIAMDLRSGRPELRAVRVLRRAIDDGLATALSGRPTADLKVVRELPAAERFIETLASGLRFQGRHLSRMLGPIIGQALVKALKRSEGTLAKRFVAAVDHPSDGVTLSITIHEVGALLGRLASPAGGRRAPVAANALHAEIAVRPGFYRSGDSG